MLYIVIYVYCYIRTYDVRCTAYVKICVLKMVVINGKNLYIPCNCMVKMGKTSSIKIILFHLFINSYIRIIIEE